MMLHRNLPLKAASLLLAIFLWFWVMLNEENPVTQTTVETEVQAHGVQQGLVSELKTPTVKVSLRGLEQDMPDLKGSVHASVSCKGRDAGTYRLPVAIKAPPDVAVVAVRPPTVVVVLERGAAEHRTAGEAPAGQPMDEADGAAQRRQAPPPP